MMKKCSKCGEEKPATPEYFHRQKKGKYGVVTTCRECVNKTPIPPQPEDYERYGLQPDADMRRCTACKEFKPATPEYFDRIKTGKYGLQAQCKECKRQRRQEIKNSPKPQYGPEDTKKCLDCGEIKLVTEYYEVPHNISGLKCYCKKCTNIRGSEYTARRYRTDPDYKLMRTIGSGVRHCLNGRKTSRSMEYIGMDVKELWQHLESQFQPGMTKDNHKNDGWHIDHIRPIASFKFGELEGEELQAAARECWHYTNLQPLWAEDNIRKGAKYEPEESSEVHRDSETTLPDLLCEESEVSDVPLCLSVEKESSDINWAEQS